MRASIAAAALAVATSTVPAAAQVPLLVSFQGRLTDAGTPVTGDANLTFRIYDAATNGNLLWTEAQVAAVAGGLFTVTLGETTPLSPGIFDGARWVGVTPAGGPDRNRVRRAAMRAICAGPRAELRRLLAVRA